MKIIAGLGNPGPKYETTRHNVGFLAIDRLADRWNASGPTMKNQGEVCHASLGKVTVHLVKPQTYMNRSGKCIAPLFNFYHCQPNDLIIIHDDLDIQPMTLRFKTGGGTGGHNGLKSIDECLGKDMNQYHRIRIGIGHPSLSPATARMSPADFVLQQLSNAELKVLDSLLDEVVCAAEEIIQGNIQNAMNKYHRSK